MSLTLTLYQTDALDKASHDMGTFDDQLTGEEFQERIGSLPINLFVVGGSESICDAHSTSKDRDSISKIHNVVITNYKKYFA